MIPWNRNGVKLDFCRHLFLGVGHSGGRWVNFDNMVAFGFALCFAKQTKIVKDTLLRKATGVRDGNLQLKTAPLAKTFAKLI